jgi:CBS domain containing-hemolysin-like protein
MSDDPKDPSEGESTRERWIDRLMQRFSLKSRDSIRDDLEEVLAEATEAADFSPHERAMLTNVLGFHRVRVSDVMVPRADIVAVAAATSIGELLGLFRTAGHSRLPVYGETLDEPLGMVHIRDLLDFITAGAAFGANDPEGDHAAVVSLGEVDLAATLGSADILRPVLFVPRSMPAIDLLVRMQASRTHMALVIDEYGGTDGLVSIEDLVESVVGDIEDEHDETTDAIATDERGGLLVDARAGLEEVSEALGHDLSTGIEAEDIDTLGGLLVTLAGRVPSRGELIAGPGGLEFEVLDADPRRLKRVRIVRRPAAGTKETAGSTNEPEAEPATSEAAAEPAP